MNGTYNFKTMEKTTAVYQDGAIYTNALTYYAQKITQYDARFFVTLARMDRAQVRDFYLGGTGDTLQKACGENYSDVIYGRTYNLPDEKAPEIRKYYRVLRLTKAGKVMSQEVFYLEATTILTLP